MGLTVHPADIDIVMDDSGRPESRGYWQQEIGYTPALAISQCGQLAIAIAGRCTSHQRLGVELQPIESQIPEFEAGAFTPQEQRLLERIERISPPRMADAVLVCERSYRESARLWIKVWPTERDRHGI